MERGAAPARQKGGGRHLLLYDGVCGLCNRVTQFVIRRDAAAHFDFAPLQSATGRDFLARTGGGQHALNTFYVVADYRTGAPRVLSKSRAVFFVLRTIGGAWRLAAAFRILPAALLDLVYDAVARSRYRLFGRYDACPIPSPEQRQRFVDL